jgi:hypothetical protein
MKLVFARENQLAQARHKSTTSPTQTPTSEDETFCPTVGRIFQIWDSSSMGTLEFGATGALEPSGTQVPMNLRKRSAFDSGASPGAEGEDVRKRPRDMDDSVPEETYSRFVRPIAFKESAMSTIHFVGGEKGGVGKSVLARALSQYCIDRGIPFAGLDADRSHGALLRYYGDYSQACDLESYSSADQIIDRALGADRQVVVDLPAQITQILDRWLNDGEVLKYATELQLKVRFWHVTDGGFDSVNLLDSLVNFQDNAVPSQRCVIVVKNHGRSDFFEQFDESDAWKSLKERGGSSMDMPSLDARTMYSIDKNGLSMWAAANDAHSENRLSPMERRRAALWLAACYSEFDRLAAIL